jgi:putative transposase
MNAATPPFHTANTEFAYQLHYHVGFRTRRCVPVFRNAQRADVLRAAISEIGQRNHYHILEMDMDNYWVRLLLSLRPSHPLAKVVQTIKANASRAVFEAFPEVESEIGQRSLWSRGYYVRGIGDVTDEAVFAYVASQRQHHEEDRKDSRLLAEYRHPHPELFFDLRPFAHCVAEHNCHLVCCPLRHVPAIDAAIGEELVAYILRVAAAKEFDVISLAVLEDHLHLFAALRPNQSPEYLAFAVLNNTSHWIGRRNPGAIKLWNAPGFWTPSAFVRTAGAVTTNVVRAHLQTKDVVPDG